MRGDQATVALQSPQRGAFRALDLVARVDARALRVAGGFLRAAEARLEVRDAHGLGGLGARPAKLARTRRPLVPVRAAPRAPGLDFPHARIALLACPRSRL